MHYVADNNYMIIFFVCAVLPAPKGGKGLIIITFSLLPLQSGKPAKCGEALTFFKLVLLKKTKAIRASIQLV